MNQGTNLGSQMGRWILLAALAVALGALLLTIRPVGAQSVVTHSATVEEHSTDEVRLAALEPDRTQIADRWELVTDANDPAGAPPNTVDHRLFEIHRMTGVMTFKTPPDYEDPKSSVAESAPNLEDKNVYKVKAKFGDGEKYLAVDVTVRVTGIEEDGSITLSNRQPQVKQTLEATLADPDKGIRSADWQWQVETGEGTGVFDNIPNAVNRRYTPKAGDVGKKLKVTATYQDGHALNYDPVYAVSEFAVREEMTNAHTPVFREDDDTTTDGIQINRRIEENSPPGTKVGPALFATDNDHKPAGHPGGEPRDEITYSLRDPTNATPVDGNDSTEDDDDDINTPSDRDGHAAMFRIDQATGQITTRKPLDRESLSASTPTYAYTVVVKATDPSGADGEATLTIHVLDVVETPQLTGPAAITYFENSANGTNNPELRLDRIPDSTATADDTADVQEAVYMATDNDLDDDTAGGGDAPVVGDIQWELTGPDAGAFQFGTATPPATYTNSSAPPTGTPVVALAPALQFRSEPDVESPGDVAGTTGDNIPARAGDNIYEITVRAWDADWLIGERHVTIRVADVDDPGTVTLSHIQPQQGVELTATLNDPDGVSGAVSWQWYPGTDDTGTPISGATKATYTPPDTELGSLTVKATYADRGSRGQQRTAMATTANTVRADVVPDGGENADPRFYVDEIAGTAIDLTDTAQRIKDNETETYTRYVLEGQHPRNVTLTALEAQEYPTTAPTTGNVKVFDGYFATATAKTEDTITPDGTGSDGLQFKLSGTGAEDFSIGNTGADRGLISTKQALDYENRNIYTLTVTAIDPAGAEATATVTIHVLNQAEIKGIPGDEKRVWVNEGKYFIDDLDADNPPRVAQGGVKWSLLTTNETQTDPEHNRVSVHSVDCQVDPENDGLCANFRFKRFNTAQTELLFAIGTGETHDAPDYEDPKDIDGTSAGGEDATGQGGGDNIYQVVVRFEWATLRSDGESNHPNPESDEMSERTYVIRVVDVDEGPKFSGADSAQSIDENSDDDLPTIMINRDLGGSVSATDPEDGPTRTGSDMKKLTFSLDLPDAYSDMFDIVPSTGEILTKSRIDYEALDLEEQGIQGGQYKSITGVTVKVTDSAPVMQTLVGSATMPTMVKSEYLSATLPVIINVRDLNETPVEAMPLELSGDAAVDYAENGTIAVDTYAATGDNAATATWTLSGADMDLFELADGANDMERMLRFKAAPDFEMPADADGNNTYMVTVTVSSGTGDNMETQMVEVTVTVTNEKEAGTVTITPTGGKVGTPLNATLTDDDEVQGAITWQWYRVAPDDNSEVAIVGSEARTDTYTPVDADVGSLLKVTATYTDGYGADTAVARLDEPVKDASVPPVFAPEMATREVDENSAAGTNVGAPITATDPNGDAPMYSIPDSGDAASFTIDSGTGQLMVSDTAMLDFETKPMYTVTVTATDPEDLTGSIAVTVNLGNVDEGGMISLSPVRPTVGTTMTAELTDPDGDPTGVTWQWAYANAMTGPFTNHQGETLASITPAASDLGKYLRVTATYTDSVHDSSSTAEKVTETVMSQVAPEFAAETATRTVNENVAIGASVGEPVMATDANGDTLTYTLGGADAASFGIDATGQITANAALDYETKSSYSVTVTATDPSGGSDSIDVTITVTDVDEDGTVTLSAASAMVGEELTASLTDPDGSVTGATWQWSKSMTMGGTFMAIAGATSMSYTPVEADADYYLRVTVSYTDGEGSGKSAMATTANKVISASLVARYDTNGTSGIQLDEVFAAIDDHFEGTISLAELFEVIDAYFG